MLSIRRSLASKSKGIQIYFIEYHGNIKFVKSLPPIDRKKIERKEDAIRTASLVWGLLKLSVMLTRVGLLYKSYYFD